MRAGVLGNRALKLVVALARQLAGSWQLVSLDAVQIRRSRPVFFCGQSCREVIFGMFMPLACQSGVRPGLVEFHTCLP